MPTGHLSLQVYFFQVVAMHLKYDKNSNSQKYVQLLLKLTQNAPTRLLQCTLLQSLDKHKLLEGFVTD